MKKYHFLLCVIDNYSKCPRDVSLEDKNGIAVTNVYQKVLDESKRRPNKILVDKGSKFYNISKKSWMQNEYIEMYSTYNEGKLVFAEGFNRTLKIKIYKYIIKKCVY